MRLWNNHSCHVLLRDVTPFGSAEVGWSALMLVLCPALSGHFLLILSCSHLLFICLAINASSGQKLCEGRGTTVQMNTKRR